MRTQWLFWTLALAMAGCEPRRPAEEAGEPHRAIPVASSLPANTNGQRRQPFPPALPLDTEIAASWTRLQNAFHHHDMAQLNQLIDPVLGLWVLEDGNAGLTIKRLAAGAAFRQAVARLPWPDLEGQFPPCPALLAVAQFPELDCGDRVNGHSGFERDGCFAGPATEFQALDFWPYARLRGGTVAQGRAAQAQVARTVLHTGSGWRFHFAKTPSGRWHLVFIDLRQACIS